MDHTKRYIEDCEATILQLKTLVKRMTVFGEQLQREGNPERITAIGRVVCDIGRVVCDIAAELEQVTKEGEG